MIQHKLIVKIDDYNSINISFSISNKYFVILLIKIL